MNKVKKTYTIEERIMYWENKIAYADKRLRALELELKTQDWSERITKEIERAIELRFGKGR